MNKEELMERIWKMLQNSSYRVLEMVYGLLLGLNGGK